MGLEDFCVKLCKIKLSRPMQAVAILWFLDRECEGVSRTAGELTKVLRNSGLGNPHSTRLGESISKTRHTLKSGNKFRIKPTSRDIVGELVSPILSPDPPEIDQDNGYIPEDVWLGTRGYIEKIARQVNGCYQFGFYDGSSVLTRRIIETLLIECYEHLGIESQIKKADGNYPMLSEIIIGATDKGHLSLGRETKKVLGQIKSVGDRSAHNRRYTTVRADLDKIQSGVRLAVDELLHLANLK